MCGSVAGVFVALSKVAHRYIPAKVATAANRNVADIRIQGFAEKIFDGPDASREMIAGIRTATDDPPRCRSSVNSGSLHSLVETRIELIWTTPART
jgi:hypothetical protein